ncbi:MAG: Uma2 family endonuclease [Pyrinomonadaceae bacterium]
MATVLHPPEERMLLPDVSWETYEQLLANYENCSGPRFIYDRGMLEIMSPSSEHEAINDIIKALVNVLAEEMELDLRGFGSTTFRREDMARGSEPDSCFYIQNVERITGVSKLDLNVHPPPDLVIEIDITSPSLQKFPLYAGIEVPEVWHYEGEVLRIFHLYNGGYVESAESRALPHVKSVDLSRFVEESKTSRRPAWIRGVRDWARAL